MDAREGIYDTRTYLTRYISMHDFVPLSRETKMVRYVWVSTYLLDSSGLPILEWVRLAGAHLIFYLGAYWDLFSLWYGCTCSLSCDKLIRCRAIQGL